MKSKNHNFKFHKKIHKSLKIPSSTIEKFPNDYPTNFYEVLNANINNEMDKNNSLKDNNDIVIFSKNKKNSIELIKKIKLIKLKSSLNSTKRENIIKSYENFNKIKINQINSSKSSINTKKIRKRFIKKSFTKSFLNKNPNIDKSILKTSKIINNNSKKNKCSFVSNSEKNIKNDMNSNNISYSLNKNIKINIYLPDNKSILKIQKSFNNKKKNEMIDKTNINKIKRIEILKEPEINSKNNKISINKEKIKKIYEINNSINTKLYKKFQKNKIENIQLDRIVIKKNDINSPKTMKKFKIKKKLNNKTISCLNGFNNIEEKKSKNYYLNNNNKKKFIYNHTEISPKIQKLKLIKKQYNNNHFIHIINNESNNSNSKVPKNNYYSQFSTKGIKTESIVIDLNSIKRKNIFKYNSDKKIKNSLICNKNILTLRENDRKKDYLLNFQKNFNRNGHQLEANYSQETIYRLSKKSKSLSRKRYEKKKIKLSCISDEENEQTNKLKNIIQSLENQRCYLKLNKNTERYSEPKKLIDKIRKVIKMKKINKISLLENT